MLNKLALKLQLPQLTPWLLPVLTSGRMKPSFFIAGFQKCGTTTLYDAIMTHPDVRPGLMKENNILAEKADRIDEFKLCFPMKSSGKITGDASHLHTWTPYGLERIKNHFPKAKVIVIMRNPVDRAYSHFNMDQKIGYIPKSMTFQQMVDLEMHLRTGLGNDPSIEETYSALKLYGNKYGWPLSRGLYHLYIQRLMDLNLDFISILMEDLELQFDSEMDRVFEFLSLRPYRMENRHSNVGEYRNAMDESVRKKLDDYYAIPNQKLESLLGFKLPW